MRDEEYQYYQEPLGWSMFLAGALIGAGVALLFAPQTGPELRRLLRKYASQAGGEAMRRGKAAWDSAVEEGKKHNEQTPG